MVVPLAFVATAAATLGAVSVVRSVRRTIARGERRLARTAQREAAERGAAEAEEVYELEHDPSTDTYRARPMPPS